MEPLDDGGQLRAAPTPAPPSQGLTGLGSAAGVISLPRGWGWPVPPGGPASLWVPRPPREKDAPLMVEDTEVPRAEADPWGLL